VLEELLGHDLVEAVTNAAFAFSRWMVIVSSFSGSPRVKASTLPAIRMQPLTADRRSRLRPAGIASRSA